MIGNLGFAKPPHAEVIANFSRHSDVTTKQREPGKQDEIRVLAYNLDMVFFAICFGCIVSPLEILTW